MQRRLAYCLLAWVMVVACVGMIVVKDYHAFFLHSDLLPHHSCCCGHSHSAEEQICVLDGMPLSEHSAHNHSSFVEFNAEDDDCAICHFTVVKVIEPQFVMCSMAKMVLSLLPQIDYLFSLYTFLDHSPGRAPPSMGNFVASNC